MNFTNNMSEAREECIRQLRKLEKIPADDVPDFLRDFVIHGDDYTIDDEGYVYDPYYKEYPDIDAIIEQYDYKRGE